MRSTLAYRSSHVSSSTQPAVPAAPSVRDLIKQHVGSEQVGHLAYMLQYPAIWYDLRLTPWVDHGVRDEEGVPTEFEPPTVQITIGVYPREGGECACSQTIPASEVPALASAVQDQIEAECFAQMRFVNQEISRFMEIVSNLQHQNSKLFALRRPACTNSHS